MSPEHDMETVHQQAERWFARLRAENCSTAEQRAFEAWLVADAVNASAYARTERLWNGLEGLSRNGEIVRARHAARNSALVAMRHSTRHRRLLAAASLAGALIIGSLAWVFSGQTATQHYATAHGEQRSMLLADGSRVILNTDTAIEMRLGQHARDVKLLKGEALFEVVHDPAHPFVVHANGNTISDIGTRFDVREINKQTTVTVVEGSVDVTRGGLAAQLEPGQQLVAGSNTWHRRTVDTSDVTGWSEGYLVFHSTPLGSAVANANRYGQVNLVIADPQLETIRISGEFRIGNTQALLRALESAFPIRAERTPDGKTVRLYKR